MLERSVPTVIWLQLAVLCLLVACAHTGPKMSQISIGMSKVEVVRVLGPPRSAAAKSRVEVLHYRDDNGFWQYEYYFVRLVNDKVESYGIEHRNKRVTDSDPPLAAQ